jgi:hypothetical protein
LLPIHVLNAALITPSGLWTAAYSANNNQATKLLEDMQTLSQKVTGLETNIKALVNSGGGPAVPDETQEKYALDCRAEDRPGLSINLLKGN